MKEFWSVLTAFQRKLFVILLLFGTTIQSFTMIRSGLIYSYGIGFWGPNGHDGIWHLALINQVLKGFPPSHPSFSGELLTNYHYFYDLLVAVISRFSFVPAINLYFQVFPVLMAFLLGLLSFLVGWKLTKNYWVGFWFAFLNYFAGSFGYFGGESQFWSMQPISTQINPPYALSLVVILSCLLMLISTKKIAIKHIILLSFLFGILINIKVYAGIIILPGLFVYSIIKLRTNDKKPFVIFLGAFVISTIIFLLTNRNSAGLLVFQPFWFIHSMIESPDRLYIPKLALARYRFLANGDYPRLFLVEAIGLFLFLAGNLGTRIIGLIPIIQKIKKRQFEEIEIFFLIGGLIALIMPLLFIQKGTSWNTIQFFYYFLFFANYFTALFLANHFRPGLTRLKILLIVVFVTFTIPTTFSTLKNYTGLIPPAALPITEIKALDFLKSQPGGYVLTYPFSPYIKDSLKLKEPVPLFAYVTSAYVSAFSGKQTFLEDEMNLDISNYDWQKRRTNVENFFSGKISEFETWGFLKDNQIQYIYLVSGQQMSKPPKEWEINLIYDKDSIRIYKAI